MKKSVGIGLVALAILAFWFSRKQQQAPIDSHSAPQHPEAKRVAEAEPEPLRAAPAASVTSPESPVPDTPQQDWMALTLQHGLTPDSLDAWAKKEGVSLSRETKGHPASGERLEISWGADPATTASFDILGEGRYQLSAVRSVYPAGTSVDDLKAMLQYKIKQPIEREDQKSAVFKADEAGLVVWFAQQDDGRLKVAFEYGAHTHEH